MAITKQEVKSRIKWIFYIILGWWVAVPIGNYIVDHSPIKNTFWLGVIGLSLILFLDD